MPSFLLIRHAHAHWTENENRTLSNQGREVAAQLIEVLQSFNITRIFSSPYLRALQTVEPVAQDRGLSIEIVEGLRERELGNWHGNNFEEAVRKTWLNPAFAFPGGETNLDAKIRAIGFINELCQLNHAGVIILSTHGNLLALILQHYDPQVDFEFWKELAMPDAYSLEVDDEGNGQFERVWNDAAYERGE